MKKVYMVITVCEELNAASSLFWCYEARSKKDAIAVIKDQKKFDKTLLINRYKYFIIEGLIISSEKINEIITNSEVQ